MKTENEIKREAERIVGFLSWMKEGTEYNVESKVLKNILLKHDPIYKAGKILDVKSKNIGAGVYKVFVKERSS